MFRGYPEITLKIKRVIISLWFSQLSEPPVRRLFFIKMKEEIMKYYFLHCVSYYFFFFFSFCGFLFQLRKTAICFMQRRLRALLWKLIPQWWRNNNLLLHSVWSLLYRIWIANRLHCCRNVSRTSFMDIMRTCQDSLPRELFRLFFIIGLYGMRQRLYPLRRPMHWKIQSVESCPQDMKLSSDGCCCLNN